MILCITIRVLKNAVIGLSETQVTLLQSTFIINDRLQDFHMNFNNNDYKFFKIILILFKSIIR